jgi:hypothetical protein
MSNPYCDALRIEVPVLEKVKDHPEANTYSLLIAALLEHGDAMTLIEVAERFEAAGVAPAERALRSLQRCKPARAPVYRDGDHYALDPHDDDADLWAFRLGLRPPKAPRLSVVPPMSELIDGVEEPLTLGELDEAWRDASLHAWSLQRLALAVLDAHGGAMTPEDVVAFVGARTRWHVLTPESDTFRRRNSTVRVRDDGRWEIGDDRGALLGARKSVRERILTTRRYAGSRQTPAEIAAIMRAAERRRAAHAAHLATLRRVLVRSFPSNAPRAVVLLDVGGRDIDSFLEDEIEVARERIAAFDVVGAVDVRPVLRALGVDAGDRRLAELGPPRKTKRLNRSGRTLKITETMLIQGSCGIARPLGDREKLETYLQNGQSTQLRRRLEADAKSLFALYQYGRLHGAVRLRWGFLDEMIPAPWVHPDEPRLYGLKRQALESEQMLEVVVGSAPGWAEPWARAQLCRLVPEPHGYGTVLVDDEGFAVDDRDVQLARIAARNGRFDRD